MADERRILLVEDDVLIGMMLVDMLDTLGYPEPAQAAAIDEALAIVDVGPVAAALIDTNPGVTKGCPVAHALAPRGIPCSFPSGSGDAPPPLPAPHRTSVVTRKSGSV